MEEKDWKELWGRSVVPDDISIDQQKLRKVLPRRLRTLRYVMREKDFGGLPASVLLTGVLLWIHLAHPEALNARMILGELLIAAAILFYLRRLWRVLRQPGLEVDLSTTEYVSQAHLKISEQLDFFGRKVPWLFAAGFAGILLLAWGGWHALWSPVLVLTFLGGILIGVIFTADTRRKHLEELRQTRSELEEWKTGE